MFAMICTHVTRWTYQALLQKRRHEDSTPRPDLSTRNTAAAAGYSGLIVEHQPLICTKRTMEMDRVVQAR